MGRVVNMDGMPWAGYRSGKPWLGVAAGALLTPLLVIALTGFISWSHFRQLWPGPRGRTSSYGKRSGLDPARTLGRFLPNEVVTTGVTALPHANRAGAVDRAVDD